MSTIPALPIGAGRTNNLALAFQEVFIVILRTRAGSQRVDYADAFRVNVKSFISQAAKKSASIGYTDEATKMALYAIIAFLDESILNSRDPAFADWARRPLQEETFGGHVAGESFFRNLTNLLNKDESQEAADALELHALCLLLGYRGRFAMGDPNEIQTILRRIREKITRIRGSYALFQPIAQPAAPPAPKGDAWTRRLTFAAIAVAVLTLLAFVAYTLVLNQTIIASINEQNQPIAQQEQPA